MRSFATVVPGDTRARNGLALIRKHPQRCAGDLRHLRRHRCRSEGGFARGFRQWQTIALTLRPIDLFPMTHHVECVALLTKIGSDLR